MVVSCPRGGQSQAVTAGLASLQEAAYGGKLRYTLSYTGGAQGSSLSDPDVQITVSMPGGQKGKPGGTDCFFGPFSPTLSWPGMG